MTVAPLAVAAQDLPRVLVLTTGGTIASRTNAPIMEGNALVQAVPQLLDHAEITVEEFSRVGSSQMTPAHWLRLAKRVNEAFAGDPDLSGVVVTHGTDTMEETAFFLHLTVRDSRPVILVGSMRSSNEISPDGPANLLNAVRVAVSPGATGMGTLIVLNEQIGSARDTWKADNRRVQAFGAPELGLLGYADPDTVVFYRAPLRPHTAQSEFDVRSIDSLPTVEIVSDYAGFDGSTLEYWADRGVDGLVLTSFAGGRTSAGARRAVEAVAETGVPVAIASRVPGGRIVGPSPEIDGVVFARDLPAHKARILLMLALTATRNGDEIRRIFEIY